MKRFRYLLEYAVVRCLLPVLRILPDRALARLVNGGADLWFWVAVRRRRIAVRNVERSDLGLSRRAARRLARHSFRHFGTLVAEVLRSRARFRRENWQERVTLDIDPATQALLQTPGQGLLLISGHVGNWEIGAQILSYRRPVVGVARPMNNPHTERLIQRFSLSDSLRLIPSHDADVGRFLAVLRQGDILGVLMDQHAGARQGILVSFLGRPAYTHTAVALLHLVTRAPLCFASCVRTAPMKFHVRMGKPLRYGATGNKEKDIRAILTLLTSELEEVVRRYPEQYLWGHRRWREEVAA